MKIFIFKKIFKHNYLIPSLLKKNSYNQFYSMKKLGKIEENFYSFEVLNPSENGLFRFIKKQLYL